MSQHLTSQRFSFAPLILLFLPYAAIAYFCDQNQVFPTGLIAVGVTTALCVILYVTRNWAELLAGVLATLLIFAVLTACALIPVVGWIASILLFLYSLASILAAINALIPYAMKAVAIWAFFLISLLPALFHPIVSPIVLLVVCLGLGSAMGAKASPFDEFVLLISSIPLLLLAIASLGRLFQSSVILRSGQFQQNVSGYTTRTGIQVGDYSRTITKVVPVTVHSVNPIATAVGSTAGNPLKDEPSDR